MQKKLIRLIDDESILPKEMHPWTSGSVELKADRMERLKKSTKGMDESHLIKLAGILNTHYDQLSEELIALDKDGGEALYEDLEEKIGCSMNSMMVEYTHAIKPEWTKIEDAFERPQE